MYLNVSNMSYQKKHRCLSKPAKNKQDPKQFNYVSFQHHLLLLLLLVAQRHKFRRATMFRECHKDISNIFKRNHSMLASQISLLSADIAIKISLQSTSLNILIAFKQVAPSKPSIDSKHLTQLVIENALESRKGGCVNFVHGRGSRGHCPCNFSPFH